MVHAEHLFQDEGTFASVTWGDKTEQPCIDGFSSGLPCPKVMDLDVSIDIP